MKIHVTVASNLINQKKMILKGIVFFLLPLAQTYTDNIVGGTIFLYLAFFQALKLFFSYNLSKNLLTIHSLILYILFVYISTSNLYPYLLVLYNLLLWNLFPMLPVDFKFSFLEIGHFPGKTSPTFLYKKSKHFFT